MPRKNNKDDVMLTSFTISKEKQPSTLTADSNDPKKIEHGSSTSGKDNKAFQNDGADDLDNNINNGCINVAVGDTGKFNTTGFENETDHEGSAVEHGNSASSRDNKAFQSDASDDLIQKKENSPVYSEIDDTGKSKCAGSEGGSDHEAVDLSSSIVDTRKNSVASEKETDHDRIETSPSIDDTRRNNHITVENDIDHEEIKIGAVESDVKTSEAGSEKTCEKNNQPTTSSSASADADKPDASPENPGSVHKVKEAGSSLKKWATGTNFIVYVSHFLSAWGDRMWSFGIGLFLAKIAPENLMLPAIYGLVESLSVFFLGALVGDWVDSTPRLKAAQLSLILQNLFVVICVAEVYAFLWFQDEITQNYGSWLVHICQAGIILVGILSNLASLARTIAVERDWIVEICGRDKDMLAKMTSSLRRIDQATLILAPIATGQIMNYAGLKNGALFIAGWNVVSVFIEYFLMWKVYNTVPALRAKKDMRRSDESPGIEAETELDADKEAEAERPNDALSSDDNAALTSDVDKTEGAKETDAEGGEDKVIGSEAESEKKEVEEADEDKQQVVVKDSKEKSKDKDGGCGKMLICSQFVALYRGWRTYMRYSVALAGIALSCLFMTVLGFDNITVAYAVRQGISDSILGILMGVSAVFGILGTFAYPLMRRRLGLVRTGIFALSCQVSCLSLCVVSVWMPGSPFDPLYYINPRPRPLKCYELTVNTTTGIHNASVSLTLPSFENSTVSGNMSVSPTLPTLVNNNSTGIENLTVCETVDERPDSYISVGMLMAGIVTARFGLWIADLTITQLFLEVVVEGERGVVNGVQSSLNKLMDVLKFVIVVGVPDIPTFGYLVVISFLFICLGWLFYAVFLRRQRGHFFHFEKCASLSNGHAAVSEAA